MNSRSWLFVIAGYFVVACAVSFLYTDGLWWRTLGVVSAIVGLFCALAACVPATAVNGSEQTDATGWFDLTPLVLIAFKGLALTGCLVGLRLLVGKVDQAWLAHAVLYGGLLVMLRVFWRAILQVLLGLGLVLFVLHLWSDAGAIRAGDVTLADSGRLVVARLISAGPIHRALDLHADGFYLRYVNKVDARDPQINTLASRLVRDAGNEPLAKTAAIFRHVSGEIAYISDPRGLGDYPKPPLQTLEAGAGDCEDQAILLCSLLESVNVHTYMAFTTNHVFVLVHLDDPALPADLRPYVTIDGRPAYALDPTEGEHAVVGRIRTSVSDVVRILDVQTRSAVSFRFRDASLQQRD